MYVMYVYDECMYVCMYVCMFCVYVCMYCVCVVSICAWIRCWKAAGTTPGGGDVGWCGTRTGPMAGDGWGPTATGSAGACLATS